MEKINVKGLTQKGTMLIVDYALSSIPGMPVGQATMNTGWQAQQINFLMNDVGVGGFFEGLIEEKPNKLNPAKPYLNVTECNMDANFGKGEATVPNCANTVPSTVQPSELAAVLLKGAIEIDKGESFSNREDMVKSLCQNVQELYGVYKVALSVQNE
jgi:hypothetical protein